MDLHGRSRRHRRRRGNRWTSNGVTGVFRVEAVTATGVKDVLGVIGNRLNGRTSMGVLSIDSNKCNERISIGIIGVLGADVVTDAVGGFPLA